MPSGYAERADRRASVDRSTARWFTPAGANVHSVDDDRRHRRIASAISEHAGPRLPIVLRVIYGVRDALSIVERERLTTVRAGPLDVKLKLAARAGTLIVDHRRAIKKAGRRLIGRIF